MGWEKRGNRLYYYRKRRVGDRVVSEYIGAGPLAELLAIEDEIDREEREAQREAWKRERDAMLADDKMVDEVVDQVRTLTRAWLLTNGYHMHKGQWRRKR